MSKMNRLLEVRPPKSGTRETLVSAGHKCEYCQGNGWFWKEDGPDYIKDPCPVCGGSGEVDAVIDICWKASSRKK